MAKDGTPALVPIAPSADSISWRRSSRLLQWFPTQSSGPERSVTFQGSVRPTPGGVPLALLGMSIFIAACGGPRITKFEVQPAVICAGERAVLRWTVEGETALTIQLEMPPTDNLDRGPGPEVFKLRLIARKSDTDAIADQELVQLPRMSVRTLAWPTVLQGSTVVASGASDGRVWNDRVRVSKVAAIGNRAIEVRHGGKAASLPGGGVASEALSGTPFGGAWDLRSPLSEAELANPAVRPTALEIQVTIGCRAETP